MKLTIIQKVFLSVLFPLLTIPVYSQTSLNKRSTHERACSITLNITTNDASCGNNDGSATVSASGGDAPYTFSWDDSSSQTTATASNLAANTYTVTVTDDNNCKVTGYANVSNSSGVQIDSIKVTNPILCNGDCNGVATVYASSGATPYSYTWNNGETTPFIDNLSAGQYIVTITDAKSCTAKDTITITEPNQLLVDANITSTVCGQQNGSISLLTTGGTPTYSYTWSSSDTLSLINNLAAGSYSVTISDENGCSIDSTFFVPASGNIFVNAQPETTTITEGEIVEITTDPNNSNYSYSWSPSTNLSCTNCSNPVANPSKTTTYIVTVSDTSTGCVGIDTVKIIVEENCGEIYVPTIFSPNGDGLNDVFCVRGKCIGKFHLQIYDRWGELLFKSNSQDFCWDGKYKGKLLNTGTFIYKIRIIKFDGEVVERSGNVNLTY